MSDQMLRTLERRAKAGDQEAAVKLEAALKRIERDPITDPRPGDLLTDSRDPERMRLIVVSVGPVEQYVVHAAAWVKRGRKGLKRGTPCVAFRTLSLTNGSWREHRINVRPIDGTAGSWRRGWAHDSTVIRRGDDA